MPPTLQPPPTQPLPADFATGPAARVLPLLPGMIAGVNTQALFVPTGGTHTFSPPPLARRLVFVVAGAGSLQAAAAQPLPAGELALLILPVGQSATVRAIQPLTLLEITYAQTETELTQAAAGGDAPAVIHYADCPTYREAIKSPQTRNRTLVAVGRVPRLAMGSVETSGPDAVAAHAHPMLEQLFFGLPGNACRVTADGASVPFGAAELLYIPLGSTHGADVAAGHRLHYLWLDFFPTAADMQWIQEQHHDDPPAGSKP